jgi:hypothetical protein
VNGLIEAVVPSLGVGLIFYIAMRYIVRADRNERNALAALEYEEDRRAAENSAPNSAGDSTDAPRGL